MEKKAHVFDEMINQSVPSEKKLMLILTGNPYISQSTKGCEIVMTNLSLKKCKHTQFFHTFPNLSFTKNSVQLCMEILIDGHMHGHLNRWTYAWRS